MLTNKLTGAGAADKTYIEDVFSTYLYTGNGSTQTINNGIDLAGKGGMVWAKKRAAIVGYLEDHVLVDTIRGAYKGLASNNTNAQNTNDYVTSFGSSGYTIGYTGEANWNGDTYASWTFRKAPKFFDVVTYTGNGGSNRAIPHSLGTTPGMIIVKCTSTSDNWTVWHRYNNNKFGILNLTDQFYDDNGSTFGGTSYPPTSSSFYINSALNVSGQTYVAYLFAHDTTTDGLIQCGSFDNSTTDINLGWEPQYVLTKKVSGTIGAYTDWWTVHDNMRGMSESGGGVLWPHLSDAESSQASSLKATATGFNTNGYFSYSSGTYIYMAIRRGPMRAPTNGTKVFAPRAISSGSTLGINLYNTFGTSPYLADDAHFIKSRASTSAWYAESRLIGKTRLDTTTTAAEVSDTYIDYSGGNYGQGYSVVPSPTNDQTIAYVLRRAPGFFDVVCYTGTGGTTTALKHSLGVQPELVIYKSRSSTQSWYVQVRGGAELWYGGSLTEAALSAPLNLDSAFTASNFFAASVHNTSGVNYVAYLFASCPGVSKVGSFTGNGSTQTINCGFTNGARFVLIKRTDSTSNWMVWDTARGITTTSDPLLLLNSTAAETSGADQIQPNSTGFTVQYAGPSTDSAPNINGATYIYLAIA